MDDMTEIARVLEKAPEARHSYFQLKYFVLGRQPTRQAQMWQCLRELQARQEALTALDLDIEEATDHLELLDIAQARGPAPAEDVLTRREGAVHQRQAARRRKTLEASLLGLRKRREFALQEARFFLAAFTALNEEEPVKDYDDVGAQQEYWNAKVGAEINLKMLLNQPLDTELTFTALALPVEAPVRQAVERLLAGQALKETNGPTS